MKCNMHESDRLKVVLGSLLQNQLLFRPWLTVAAVKTVKGLTVH